MNALRRICQRHSPAVPRSYLHLHPGAASGYGVPGTHEYIHVALHCHPWQ